MFQLPPEAFIRFFFSVWHLKWKNKLNTQKNPLNFLCSKKPSKKIIKLRLRQWFAPLYFSTLPPTKKKAEGILTRERKIHHCRASFSSVEKKKTRLTTAGNEIKLKISYFISILRRFFFAEMCCTLQVKTYRRRFKRQRWKSWFNMNV